MTKVEILAMEAGRDLDELIATRVMNLENVRWEAGEHHNYLLHGPEYGHIVPNYSTQIVDAWAIFEKNGTMGVMGYMGGTDCYCILHSGFNENSGVGEQVQAEANTIQEAICKAALLAVMDS